MSVIDAGLVMQVQNSKYNAKALLVLATSDNTEKSLHQVIFIISSNIVAPDWSACAFILLQLVLIYNVAGSPHLHRRALSRYNKVLSEPCKMVTHHTAPTQVNLRLWVGVFFWLVPWPFHADGEKILKCRRGYNCLQSGEHPRETVYPSLIPCNIWYLHLSFGLGLKNNSSKVRECTCRSGSGWCPYICSGLRILQFSRTLGLWVCVITASWYLKFDSGPLLVADWVSSRGLASHTKVRWRWRVSTHAYKCRTEGRQVCSRFKLCMHGFQQLIIDPYCDRNLDTSLVMFDISLIRNSLSYKDPVLLSRYLTNNGDLFAALAYSGKLDELLAQVPTPYTWNFVVCM